MLKDKRSRAVALQYGEDDDIPKVIASGAGELARQIIEIAVENKVPLFRNDALSDMLSGLEVGAEISQESYTLVAEIISFLFQTDREWQKRKDAQPS